MKKIIQLCVVLLVCSWQANAQCTTAGGQWPNTQVTVDNTGAVQTYNTGLWTDEFSDVTGFNVGDEYEFTVTLNSDGSPKFITLIDGSNTVVASGMSPLTFTATDVDLDIYRHDDDGSGGCTGVDENHTGTIQNLSVVPPPAPDNDDCSGALPLDCGVTVTGTTENATASGLDAECNNFTSSDAFDLFYTFQADGVSSYTVSLNQPAGSTGLDGVIFVYSGPCDDLSSIACSDSGNPEQITLDAPAEGTYTVRIFDYAATAAFTLDLTCEAPPECTLPIIESLTPVETCNEDGTGTFVIEIDVTDPGDEGTVISDGTNTYSLVQGLITTMSYDSGTTVTLTVDAIDDDCDSDLGEFTFTCPLPAPDNDDCSGALPLDCGVTVTGTTEGATASGLDAECNNFTSSDAFDLFYTFQADGVSSYTVSLNQPAGSTGLDGVVFVYSGPCDDLSSIACSDSGNPEQITLDVPAEGTYTVRIFDYAATAAFTLDLTCVAPPACVAPTIGNVTVADNCNDDGTGTFNVEIEVTDAGDEGTVISDGTNTYPVIAGMVIAGPYNSGDVVNLTVDAIDDACDSVIGDFTFTCPPPAPDNDDCSGALPLDCGVTVTGTTEGATASGLDAECNNFTSSDAFDLFYTFQADGVSSYTVSLNQPAGSTGLDGVVFVYSGPCDDLSSIACSDSGNPEQITLDVPAEGTYTVRIFDYSGTAAFTLDLTCEAPPACVPPTIASSTVAENCSGDGIGTFNVEIDVTDAGSEGTVISDGTNTYPVTAGMVIAGPYNSGDVVNLTVDAIDDACDSDLGEFTFTCPLPAPDNDDCSGALPLDCGVTVTGTTEGATASGLDAECNNFTSSDAFDLFYTFQADGVSSYTVSLNQPAGSTGLDGVVFVYSGPCDDLSSIACSDSGNPEQITLDVPAEGTYTVRIFDYSGTAAFTLDLTCEAPPACVPPTIASSTVAENCSGDGIGTFNVEIEVTDAGSEGTVISDGTNTYPVTAGMVIAGPYNSGDTVTLTVDAADDACDSDLGEFTFTCPLPAPDNDLCLNATPIACGDTLSGTNVDATDGDGVANDGCGSNTGSAGVWYAFMGTGETVTASTCSAADFDTEITVYTGACDDLTCLGNNDDGANCSGNTSEFEFDSEVGTTYYIYVSGWNSSAGNFDLSITCEQLVPAPANDDCINATTIACGETVMGSTANATDSGGNAAPDVFYVLSGTSSDEEVTASLCGSSFDTVIRVFNACDGTEVFTNDDACDLQSQVTFIADGETDYYIMVEGFGNNSGDYTLTVNCESSSDPCDTIEILELFWTGAVDTNWENMNNWDGNSAPGLTVFADVVIPSGVTNYPILTVGQNLYIAECSSLVVETGASLTVNPNVEVTNDGMVSNAGTVTFESNASGTAYIGSGVGMFMGDFTVERYIPAKRAYRQLSPAVTTSTPISMNWQQDTHITGPAGNTDGFDVTLTGNPSAYIFDNVAYTYEELENTNATNLIPGTMYHILVRGDRNTDLTNNNATPSVTTLRATGELTAENMGSHTIALNVPEQRFIAVGNPYQAQIDMGTVLTSGTNINPNFYWVWDPTLGTRGAYTAIVAATGMPSSSSSDANQFLQAGQAGWVYTDGAGASSVTFDQNSKNNTGFETTVFSSNNQGQLSLSLYENSAFTNNESPADGVLLLFGANGNNAVDANDAPNITNLDENFASNNNGALLSIESRAIPEDNEVIQLEINTYRNSNYTIVAEGNSLQGATPFLFDNFTGVYTEIPQNGVVNYSYSVDLNNAASVSGDRFTIVYQAIVLATGDFDISSVKLYPNPTSIGKFYVDVPLGMDDLEISIYNLLGTRLYHETGFTAGGTISVETGSRFSAGTYFVKLKSNGKSLTKKLIIN